MATRNVELIKKTYGVSTYQKAIDTSFRELVSTQTEEIEATLSVDEFFNQYERLFFDIPISGSINSHSYMIERSTQYVGGIIQDQERQALIEEINSLRQQLLDLGQTYLTISNVT
ncbi:MAG: hypothetical protein EB120_02120 [Proteobacteria bacterium]|nr:hypothetical protein [Pseudomonadota bacterium]